MRSELRDAKAWKWYVDRESGAESHGAIQSGAYVITRVKMPNGDRYVLWCGQQVLGHHDNNELARNAAAEHDEQQEQAA